MSDGAGFVLDASALLAHLLAEPGGDVVRDTLAEHAAVMSAVNWAEVLSRLASAGADPKAQLDALMNERLRGAVEAAGVLEVAIQRHPAGTSPGGVKRDRR